MKKDSKHAFTLAETLITLAIIGVVAALTIPVLVGKYQKHALYTQFMKSYNTLSRVLQVVVAENGSLDDYDDDEAEDALIEKYIIPRLNIAETTTMNELIAKGYKRTALNAGGCGDGGIIDCDDADLDDEDEEEEEDEDEDEDKVYIMADGSFLWMSGATNYFFDVNGMKSPNKWGRDIFYIDFGDEGTTSNLAAVMNENPNVRDMIYDSCDPSNDDASGKFCAYRLLLDGKMDY